MGSGRPGSLTAAVSADADALFLIASFLIARFSFFCCSYVRKLPLLHSPAGSSTTRKFRKSLTNLDRPSLKIDINCFTPMIMLPIEAPIFQEDEDVPEWGQMAPVLSSKNKLRTSIVCSTWGVHLHAKCFHEYHLAKAQ